MTIREQLNSIAEKRIIILDGAMGSVIQHLNLDEKSCRGSRFADHSVNLSGCSDLLCLTRPGAIGAIHDTYLEAGADIIETCSFNSTSISLSDYGLGHLSCEISAAAARIARNAADKFSDSSKPRFVAGSIGPTSKGASLYPDVNDPGRRSISWDELEAAYYDNARGLLDGGVDLFLVETIFDTLNAKAALFAIGRLIEERNIDIPVIISAVVSGDSGRLLSGQSLEAFCISALHVLPNGAPWAIGLNCSFHAPKLLPHLRLLSEIVPCYVCAYPNAGLPDKSGHYDETPKIMSSNIEPFFNEGLVNIIGGCCGSTPAHISMIADKALEHEPRRIPRNPRIAADINSFSGLEPFYTRENTICIDNAANSAMNDDLHKLIAKGEYEDAADTARDMIEDGASILNVETDDEKALNNFLDYALMNPYAAKVPFMINSSRLNVLEAGLKRLQGRGLAGIVEEGDADFGRKIKIIRSYGAVPVIRLIEDNSMRRFAVIANT